MSFGFDFTDLRTGGLVEDAGVCLRVPLMAMPCLVFNASHELKIE